MEQGCLNKLYEFLHCLMVKVDFRYATLRSIKPDMSDNPPPSIPTGRARGRARARAFTQEELDAVRMPGQAPKMKLVGRNYYDPEAKVDLKAFKLELWPGYETSIRQHENEVLLCCEVSHKILRTDTVLEQMQDVYKRDRANFRSGCEKILLGCIVMTRYNNRTYRIDDIAWDKHPTESFESSKGTPMTYIQYYEGKYNRTIRDAQQPLLVSMPTLREKRAGVSGPVLLVPELCFMTGLSDEQRANFNTLVNCSK